MTDATWWYEWNGRQAGPVTEAALLELVRSGLLRPAARVWCAGMPGWEELGRVPLLARAVPVAAPTTAVPAAATSPVPAPATPTEPVAATVAPPPEREVSPREEPAGAAVTPDAQAAAVNTLGAREVEGAAAEGAEDAAGGPAPVPATGPREAEAPPPPAAAGATAEARPVPGGTPQLPAAGAAPAAGGASWAPPGSSAPGASWSPPPGGTTVGGWPPGMAPTSTAAVIGLGIVTLGIYPMIRFYQAAMAYEELAGRRSRFAVYFWLSVGLALAGGPLHVAGGLLGFAAHVGALVFTILTLFEVLALRADVCRRQAIAPSLTPDSTHKTLFVVGLFTAWLVVGIVLLLVQAVKFFHDHRAIGDALRARGGAAPPAPAAPAPPGAW